MKINHPHLQFKEEIPLRPCTYYVVVHHTAKEHYTIQQWHKEHSKKKDWLGFGYHYFIDQNTCEIYEGRQRNEEGSHVKSYNDCSIGVCFDGDFDKNEIKDAQLRASVELIAYLQLIYAAPLLRHKDFPGVKKSCPGKNFHIEDLQALVDEKKYELLKEILKLPVATCDGLSFKESLEKRNCTEYVTIHHAKAYGTIKEVHQWWIKSGKAGVPYHYFIDKNGKVFEGRPRDTKGALAQMINSRAVGIGLEGDFDKNPVNPKQWDSCVKLAALLEMFYRAKSYRHSDFSETTSPGKNFAFDTFRHEVRELKAAAVSALSKRLDGGMPVRQMPPLTFIPKSKYDAASNHPNKYIPLLKGKKVGVVCNHTSMVENVHLVDFLRSKSIDVVKIFAPEHGFRGDADAGACVNDGKDSRTGLPVISLFGRKGTIKPSAETLKDVDVILFDIQDVGVRFYTYLTNLTDMMESAAENGKPFILLDRPNPNGFYVDGPVLQPEYVSSFVGRTPIPIVYGLTIGEYATMVHKEGWLKNKDHCNLTVVWMEHYNRHAIYELPVKPSPNLPDWQSVYLYPSLCLFEGTIVSVGRGTGHPFHCYGHPEMRGAYSFVPTSMPGARNPLHKNECCRGESLVGFANDFKIVEKRLHLEWLRDAYLQLKHKDFFTSYFLKLAGTPELQEDIMADKTIEEIQFSWQQGIQEFKRKIREGKYLHY